jgi:hypothetical protein
VIGPSLEQPVLEGEFGEGTELVVVVFLGVAADDVVGLLLPLVDPESLEALLSLGELFGAAAGGVHTAQVRRDSCSFVVCECWQFEAGIVAFRIAVISG